MILNFNINNNIWLNYALLKTENLDYLNYKLTDELEYPEYNYNFFDIINNTFDILRIELDSTYFIESEHYDLWSGFIKSSNIFAYGSEDYYFLSYILLNFITGFTLFTCSIFFLSSFYEKFMPLFFKKLLNLVNTFIINCLSYYEIISLMSSYIIVSVFFFVLSFSDEDISDLVLLLIFLFLIFLLYGLVLSLGFIKCYYFLNSNNSGYVFKKKIFDDIINLNLSLLRIFVCWIRYIFYDLQVDFIDMVLIYTEDINYELYDSNVTLNFFYKLCATILDLIIYTILLIMCLVKLSIASFLMWLIIDLFLLRIGFFISEHWLIFTIRDIVVKNLKLA